MRRLPPAGQAPSSSSAASGPDARLDRRDIAWALASAPPHARQRRRIVGETSERRREARLQRNARLSLDELVGEIDDRALVESPGVEGEIHVTATGVGDLGKPNSRSSAAPASA